MLNDLSHPIWVFISAFGVSAFAGVATYLRFSRKMTWVGALTAILNAGCTGLAVSLIWYQHFRKSENVYGLIGFCVLAGMGGSVFTDFVWTLLTGGTVRVVIKHDKESEDE